MVPLYPDPADTYTEVATYTVTEAQQQCFDQKNWRRSVGIRGNCFPIGSLRTEKFAKILPMSPRPKVSHQKTYP